MKHKGKYARFKKGSRRWLLEQQTVIRRLSLRRTTFVAITGSCGKTTTVTLSGAILSTKGICHIGVRRNSDPAAMNTVRALSAATAFCVQETGVDKPGTLEKSLRFIRPSIGIVTNIGTDHYRNFRSLEATAAEKGKLIERLPRTGIAILNGDDSHVAAMASLTQARVMTFGTARDATLRALGISSAWPDRLSLTVMHGEENISIQTQLVGEHWVTSVLAAIACGLACGVSLKACATAIERCEPVFARYSAHVRNGSPAFVLDTRKAPIWTMQSGFTFVKRACAPRKTIVLGTISDAPGGMTGKRYRTLALAGLEVADRVVFVGLQAFHVDKLRHGDLANRLFSFRTSAEASAFLNADLIPDELIFVKGSISDHLERTMLSHLDRVVCWREQCRSHKNCPECPNYRIPAVASC